VEVLPLVLDFQLTREEGLLSMLTEERGEIGDGICFARVERSVLRGRAFRIEVVVFRLDSRFDLGVMLHRGTQGSRAESGVSG